MGLAAPAGMSDEPVSPFAGPSDAEPEVVVVIVERGYRLPDGSTTIRVGQPDDFAHLPPDWLEVPLAAAQAEIARREGEGMAAVTDARRAAEEASRAEAAERDAAAARVAERLGIEEADLRSILGLP